MQTSTELQTLRTRAKLATYAALAGATAAALAMVTLAEAQRGTYRAGPTHRATSSSSGSSSGSSSWSSSNGFSGSSSWSSSNGSGLLLPPAVTSNEPDFWEQQKQMALDRAAEATQEKADCKTKYWTPSFVRDCEVSAEKYRAYWHERFLSASREFERLSSVSKSTP